MESKSRLLFEKGDFGPRPNQVITGGDTGDPTADDDHFHSHELVFCWMPRSLIASEATQRYRRFHSAQR